MIRGESRECCTERPIRGCSLGIPFFICHARDRKMNKGLCGFVKVKVYLCVRKRKRYGGFEDIQ